MQETMIEQVIDTIERIEVKYWQLSKPLRQLKDIELKCNEDVHMICA